MRRLLVPLALALLLAAAVGSARAEPGEYGLAEVSGSTSTLQAGAHSDFASGFVLKTVNGEGKALPSATATASFELPPGLLANPRALPRCTIAELTETDVTSKSNDNGCPQASQVGITEVTLLNVGGNNSFNEPVYNLVPAYGEPARLGFIADIVPVVIDTELRSGSDYGVTARAEGISSLIPLLSAHTTLWGVPADESHDAERITPYEAVHNGGVPETPGGRRSAGLVPAPFTANPTRCATPAALRIIATPYALPDLRSEMQAPLGPFAGCGLLDFSPALSLEPSTAQAESPSGLDAELSMPRSGLEHVNLLAEATLREAEVTLPLGITVNPSQAAGLGACSEAEFARESAGSAPGEGCPNDSKIGSATAITPLLGEPAEGSLFIAEPYSNPSHSLLALYMVLRIPERGVLVKLPARISTDPETGQVTALFGEAPSVIPQLPVSSFRLHFRAGARSPLVTPPACGHFEASATFTSWSAQTITTHPGFEITGGSGGSCPPLIPPFRPGFEAGAINNDAGSFSPYYLRFSRSDVDQELSRFSTTLPPGSLAKLAGVSQCPDAQIAAAAARSGAEERAAPSCPANSEIGRLLAGAGVGLALTHVPGKLYLAGPYRGAPLSIAAIVPALAGPFDLGTVVTRLALRLNPVTGIAEVDGSGSEPIPRILDGIPLKLREVRVYVDRSDFTTNPTDCDPKAFAATIWPTGPLGGGAQPVSLDQRFQAANCARLPFKPRLSLRLKGPTRRTAHPRLIANLTAKPGEANVARAQVRLPKAAFLDQSHIKTICTRVQFAAGSCPSGSIYGKASATTPLLDYALSGPVYLRSSNHQLPDLVVKLKGPAAQPIEVHLVGRTDSVKGALRNTFEAVPDAPVSRFHLELFGGKRGLVELSSGFCKHPKATVQMDGQNGKVYDTHPLVGTSCHKDHRGSNRHSAHSR